MHYALTGPGKRLRPVLALTVAEMLGEASNAVLDLACAVEMVHACSLILDDMPMMDDAALRRGRTTTHRIFGDDVAILAALGLLNRAYAVVVERVHQLTLERYTGDDLVHLLTEAVGSHGLIGGQALDLEEKGRPAPTADEAGAALHRLEFIHSHKTGALFTAAAELGVMAVDGRRRDLAAVTRFAKNLGLAFQIMDDLLDRQATSEETGKDTGKDADQLTFVGLLGPDGAEQLAGELLDFAIASLEPLGRRAAGLHVIAEVVRQRGRL